MAAWLLAFAYQARQGPSHVRLPRRLIWVVNRRVVVDQATEEAEALRRRISDRSILALNSVRQALGALVVGEGEELLAVSTLRGQFADNAEWREHPERPAIIVGTVDMIGSRLLFSGYGRGFKSRPLHAGFVGQDALLIHDEAHLEPAFQELITSIQKEQERCHEFRPIRVMALTATARQSDREPFVLSEADKHDIEIRCRIEAKKGMSFRPVDNEKQIVEQAFQIAVGFKDSGKAILVFLTRVEDVQDLVERLRKQNVHVLPLTGTMRGRERDALAEEDVFRRFVPGAESAAEGTVCLVCTSAGEVGINISADHLVCDLSTLDRIVQRLGRVNRFGNGDARVELIHTAEVRDEGLRRTLDLLGKLPLREDGRHDASPVALEGLPNEERELAFSPKPTILPVTEILFDSWAMTSVRGRMPGRPPVADWLHGIDATGEPKQTCVAWRQEVELIREHMESEYPPADLIEDYPLKPHELLRDREDRVVKHLKKIVNRAPDTRAWLLDDVGGVKSGSLSDLLEEELGDCTVVLSPKAGGLTSEGFLDGSGKYDESLNYDIADEWKDDQRRARRCRTRNPEDVPEGMRLVRSIDFLPESEEADDAQRYWRWYVRPRSADDDGTWNAPRDQDWDVHTDAAERFARAFAEKAGLSEPESSAIILAAKFHDHGKRRELWQRSIGNSEYPARVLAKSKTRGPAFQCKYRHELGSLADALLSKEFGKLVPKAQELALHVIAAHHGRARPHFPSEEITDPKATTEAITAIAREVPRRYARLQRQYGRWGLAYLESLVRAADALASERPDLVKAASGAMS